MAAVTKSLSARGLCGARLLVRSTRGPAAARRVSSVVVAATKAKVEEKLPVVAGLAASSALGAAAPAHASDVDSVTSSLIDLVRAGGEAAKTGVEYASKGAEYAKSAYDTVAPVVKTAVDVAAPVVTDAAKAVAGATAPVLSSGLEQAEKALASAPGVDAAAPVLKTAVSTTEQAVTVAKPALEQALHLLATTEPAVLGEWALGLVAAYYLAPPLFKAAGSALRGYAGEVTPAAALDALCADGSALLLDIRSQREKESSGLVDLPNNGKVVELELAAVEDRRLRSQLRNVGDLEVKVTAMQIAALKRLNKGSPVYLLDGRGGTAKAVARELARRGFGRVYVVAGGFSGWANAKLRTRPSASVSRVEVLAPGSFRPSLPGSVRTVEVLPAGSARGARALPAPRS